MASATPTTLQDAKTVYDYHRMHMSLHRDVDAVFCLCSLDTRVAEHAARLLLDGYGQYLIFAGGAGKLTQDRFSKPEAEVFADIAVQMGVPAEKIITEPRSTNTGENVRFTWELLQQKGLHPRSFILVQKPYMERRTFATFSKQWPDPETEFMVTSPELEWSGYPNEDNPRDLVISIAVGDLIRIREYPARGFQISQDIPDEVWQAGQRLISDGSPHVGVLNLLRSWLAYQPPPIPLINRSLPSNGTTMFVLEFHGLDLFFQFYALPLEGWYLVAFAERAGYVFVVNLPILYLLAAKNQSLKALTGYSYEALNIFHRRVGELMCLAAAVHFAGMVAWVGWWAPDVLQPDESWSLFFTRPLAIYGVLTFAAYELLHITSLGSFRQRWYEAFLASHVALQIIALVFLYPHFFTASPYVCATLVIFLVDRLVYRLALRSATVSAELSVLEGGETVLLSADWDIPRQRSSWGCFGLARGNIRHGWYPADRVCVTIPELGRGHALQAHPFTIASAAPDTNTTSPDAPAHAWLNLLIRVRSGFKSDLLRHAHLNGRASVRLDGPYRSRDALGMLRGSHTAVLVAGGSGTAVVFPLVWDLARRSAITARRKVMLYWVIHSRAHLSQIPKERPDELRRCGVHVTIPEPTAEAGCPDVPGYVAGLASAANGTVGIVVSGPDGLNRSVRNAYAQAIRRGADARLRVEKFG
ncbi:hypothetical protein DL767_001300 [Monosporascus sp. MG133]|nr:hypothetical protein DL767_001300 [Monosporascus sp. MG133]